MSTDTYHQNFTAAELTALTTACPTCKADAGTDCVKPYGSRCYPHKARINRAVRKS